MIYIFCTIFLILFIAFLYIFFNIVKLKDYKFSLEYSISSIEDALSKKFDCINDLLDDINNKGLKDKFSYNSETSLQERENALFSISWDINKYVKDKKLDKFYDDVVVLNSMEENLDGLKDFYNSNVLNYNEIFLKPYLNKIFRFFKFSDYKSFKVRKLEDYEIFKN